MALPSDPPFSTAEAANYLGVSAGLLRKMRGTGTGPVYIRIGERRIVYRRHDLDVYLAASARISTRDEPESGAA